MSKKQVTCNKCGKTGLVWATSKAGKFYLTDAEATAITGENGKTIKTLQLAHKCMSAEEQEIAAGFQQAADKAHALEAQRDAITAQIDALLDQEGELADDDVALVRTMTKQRALIAGEIQALQDKFNDGWKF
jgi:chromosome segregation ATPase